MRRFWLMFSTSIWRMGRIYRPSGFWAGARKNRPGLGCGVRGFGWRMLGWTLLGCIMNM